MQGIERSKVLAKKNHEDQLKYCLLLEAGEVLRKIVERSKQTILEWNAVLPAKYKATPAKVPEDSTTSGETDSEPMMASKEFLEQIENALVKCNTDTICSIIGNGVSSKRAKTFSSLSREYLWFYCVLLGVVDGGNKVMSREGMVCMLTDHFYSFLEKKYIKVPRVVVERDVPVSTLHSREDGTPKKIKALAPSEHSRKAGQATMDEAAHLRAEEVVTAVKATERSQPSGSKIFERSESFADSTPTQTHDAPCAVPPQTGLLERYACYFEEGLAMSPVLPMDRLAKIVEAQTGNVPVEAELQQVAQSLHDMMQVVYCPNQKMLYLV